MAIQFLISPSPFKDGKIVEYTAKEGYEVLKELVETDEGSHYLGEVALVDHFSPISQSNQIFYETLLMKMRPAI